MTEPTPPPDGESRRSRPQQNKGFAQSVAFSAARGALLIGAAVVLGIVLLQVVDSGSPRDFGDGGGSTATSSTTSTTAPASGSTTTTTAAKSGSKGGAAVKQPGEIRVQVLNGSGVQGAAASMSQKLQSSGYVVVEPTDTSSATGNAVYCTSGLDEEAAALAAAAGTDPAATAAAMPDPPPSGTDSSANCVVVLGS